VFIHASPTPPPRNDAPTPCPHWPGPALPLVDFGGARRRWPLRDASLRRPVNRRRPLRAGDPRELRRPGARPQLQRQDPVVRGAAIRGLGRDPAGRLRAHVRLQRKQDGRPDGDLSGDPRDHSLHEHHKLDLLPFRHGDHRRHRGRKLRPGARILRAGILAARPGLREHGIAERDPAPAQRRRDGLQPRRHRERQARGQDLEPQLQERGPDDDPQRRDDLLQPPLPEGAVQCAARAAEAGPAAPGRESPPPRTS